MGQLHIRRNPSTDPHRVRCRDTCSVPSRARLVMNAFHVNFIRLGNIAAHATKPSLLPPVKTLAFTNYTTRCNILQFKQRSSLHLRVPNACIWCQGGMHMDPVYGIPEVPFPQRFAAPSQKPITCPSLLFLVVPRESNPTVGIA